MRQLILGNIWHLVQEHDLPHSLPIIVVGERQVAVSAEVVWQDGFDENGEAITKPMALQIQLIPAG